jgi:hypothetical protein
MGRPKKPVNVTEDLSDILGEDSTPGGTENMPDMPRESENTPGVLPLQAEAQESIEPPATDSSAQNEPDSMPEDADNKPFTGFEVVTEFRDINDFSKLHRVGSDVSYFEPSRLHQLKKLGYIKAV